MELTPDQKQALYDDGYTMLPGAVPRDLVDAAVRAIHSSIGSNGYDPQAVRSACPELREAAPITDLFNGSSLPELAESAIGRGTVPPVGSGQIALRFPTTGERREPRPHLDGMHTKNNGVPEGVIQNFTALVGVFLRDVTTTYAGNFTVWPGTHRVYEEYFRANRPQSLLDGMPPVRLPEPQQITARAGDAILCHYQLAHGTAGNVSPDIRYAVFFRLRRHDHESVHWECMTDIWLEWEGMAAPASAGAAAT